MNYNFTAEKEDELDLIANGSKQWKDALNDFGEILMKKYKIH